ncbi:MAG TPA: hypothetical protein VH024_15045 [Candidatus Angelobacter sp.]|nr:hypothetical protein [Candidatus Angelobacter sp.]
MKGILAVILFSCAAMAQNDAAIDKAKSACGPGRVHFDVEATDYTESIIQPASGKALVYVIAEGQITARIGLNGAWVGAVEGDSHMFSLSIRVSTMCAPAGNPFFQKKIMWLRFPVLPPKPARFITSGCAPQFRVNMPPIFWTWNRSIVTRGVTWY